MSTKSLTAVLTPGNVIAGKFRVERVLGKGGMGFIVAAMHLQLEKRVALKFFRGDLGLDREAAERFTREARAAARLRSEHVARVLDVGATDDDDIPYIVMEFLQGQPLDEIVGERGPLEVESAVEIAIQVCEGLAEAHARGIVHRDIKPANLFLVEPTPGWRTAKILDFGISRLDTKTDAKVEGGRTLTTPSPIVGTPCYMSPEQLEAGTVVDLRTDIWSLGATLHEILTGTPPFDPELDFNALASAIRTAPAPLLRGLRREIPAGLEAVVSRCLEKDRAARFDNAADLALALLPYAPARARVTVERAGALAKGDPLPAEPSAELPRVERPAPEPPAPGSQEAQRAANRTTNRITSRGIGGALGSATSEGTIPYPRDGGGGSPPRTSTLSGPPPFPPGSLVPSELMPNLRPPLLSKSLAVMGGVILALASGTIAINWLGGSRSQRQPAIVEAQPAPVPAVAPSAPPPAPPAAEPATVVTREATPSVVPARRAATAPAPSVEPPAPAAEAASIPKIAIAVPAVDPAERTRPPRTAPAAHRTREPQETQASRQGSTSVAATSTAGGNDAPASSRATRRAAAAPSALPSASSTGALARRNSPTPPRPTSVATEPPPVAHPLEEVDPAGGRAPLRPILTRNPYEGP